MLHNSTPRMRDRIFVVLLFMFILLFEYFNKTLSEIFPGVIDFQEMSSK